jgi:serine/threonine-protein kinase
LDARSDIFSFGVLLYEVFTGVRPFHGNSNVACMRMILDADPPAPSTIVRGFPSSLQAIVLCCLEKKREKRYPTARELTANLRAALNTLPATAEVLPGTQRHARRSLYAGAAVLALGACALLPPVRNAIGSHIFHPGAAAGGGAFDDYHAARTLLDRYDKPGYLNRALQLMQSAIQKDPKYASAYAGLSEAYYRRNATAPDANWIFLARDSAEKCISLDPDLALGPAALGYALFAAGKLTDAASAFRKAADLDPKSIAAAIGLAKVTAAQGNPQGAETLFRRAIQLDLSEWLPSLEYCTFLYNNARYKEAIETCEGARRLTPDNTRILTTEAAAYHLANQYEEAASLLQQALEIEPAARTYANLGTLRFFQGRFTEAVGPMEKAVQLQATNYLYWGNLGDAYRWAPGLQAKAPDAYSRAIALAQTNVAASPADAVLRARLAGYLAKSGQPAAALAELKQFEGLPAKSGMALFKAAIAYEAAGSRDPALRSLESALRAGYSMQEIQAEQELVNLRSDIRYQQLLARLSTTRKELQNQK